MKETRISSILKHLPCDLKAIPKTSSGYMEATDNCENIIGSIELPLGIAGPVNITSCGTTQSYCIPLATSEKWLVASINRGIKACNTSNGITSTSTYRGISRAPVFETASLQQSLILQDWIYTQTNTFATLTKDTSQYLEFLDVHVKCVGTNVFMRCMFDAKDAMGMNMATFAAEKIAHYITAHQDVEYICVSSNFCSDKKQTSLNFIQERGFAVQSECVISAPVIQEILKTDTKSIMRVYTSKIQTGSMLAGTIGQNAHIANTLAALYLATGQDIAHVVDGSNGITTLKEEGQSIRVSVYLPSIVCGVIGGGTPLPKQKEALSLMNVHVDTDNLGKTNRLFSSIIGAVVLCGEISLLASLAAKNLASVHKTHS